MQVYLPDDLFEQVKSRSLPASELLQNAVRAEVRRQDLLAETARYVEELAAEVAEPTAAEVKRARAIAARVAKRGVRRAV
jgi:post-segregation antitoxin (ccd killing protein)